MSSQPFWFTARGAGLVSLILVSFVVVLGIMSRSAFGRSWWPRFLTPALHRNLAFLSLIFLLLHIGLAVLNPFTHLGLTAATIPFASYYRTVWLGLGTISFELMLAVLLTSAARPLLGRGAWKAVHVLSYPLWLTAVAHTLGTGSDTGAAWMRVILGLCVSMVVGAVIARLIVSPVHPLSGQKRVSRRRFRGYRHEVGLDKGQGGWNA